MPLKDSALVCNLNDNDIYIKCIGKVLMNDLMESNHKLYLLLLHKLGGLHWAKMAISNWVNPSPP